MSSPDAAKIFPPFGSGKVRANTCRIFKNFPIFLYICLLTNHIFFQKEREISELRRGFLMDFPSSAKPAAMGAVAGAVALAIVGFTWGGWMTASKAAMAASNQSQAAVVAALLPICVQQAGADPDTVAKIAQIKDASSYQRSEMVTTAGWATMPGATDADRGVARACAEALTK